MRIHSVFRLRNLLFFLVPLSLVGGAVFGVHSVRLNRLRGEHEERLALVAEIYQQEVDKHLSELATLVAPASDDESIRAAWLAQDRGALLKAALPTYRNLDRRYSTTHFYFHDKRGFNYLRVHEPMRNGDRIDRWSLQKAMKDDCPAGGVELGPLGTLTIRYVEPWQIDGQLVGYLELGLEVGHIADQLCDMLGTDVVLAIRKELLDREGWERGQRLLGRIPHWNSSEDVVVVGHTFAHLPDAVLSVVCSDRSEHSRSVVSVRDGGRSWMAGFVPLHDARKRQVGEIVVLSDLSSSAG